MQEIWLKIITRAWNEPDFKTRLLTETDEVLKEYNVPIPTGVTYQVVEDEAVGKRYLILPPAPDTATSVIDSFNRDPQSGDPGF